MSMLFTTSWDDGYKADLNIGALLQKHGCTGTFYVCPAVQHGQEMLSEDDIRALSQTMEIGGHSLRHQKLASLSAADATEEIRGSKEWVERVTGKPCEMFCYPKGSFAGETAMLVKKEGYLGARTVDVLSWEHTDAFRMPTTLQAYPFPMRRSFAKPKHLIDPFGPARVLWSRLNALDIPLRARVSWLPLAKAVFTHALETQKPFFHLWGHGAELDRFGMWEELDAFLSFVSSHNVTHVTNAELTRQLASQPRGA